MIRHDVEARSATWFYLRAGRPTASEFHKIVTPTGRISKQCVDYAHGLLAELMLGRPLDTPETQWMIRGSELEFNALEAYEFHVGCETDRGGFITVDDGTYGCSPDRLVGDVGILELKCPAPQTHVGYLLSPESMERDKYPQIMGQMLVCERQWVDLVSFHPEMPIVVRRVNRDEEFIESLRAALCTFVQQLALMREKLEGLHGPFRPIEIPTPDSEQEGDFDVTPEDVAAMIAKGLVEPDEGRI